VLEDHAQLRAVREELRRVRAHRHRQPERVARLLIQQRFPEPVL
jgi:hypothetical protein